MIVDLLRKRTVYKSIFVLFRFIWCKCNFFVIVKEKIRISKVEKHLDCWPFNMLATVLRRTTLSATNSTAQWSRVMPYSSSLWVGKYDLISFRFPHSSSLYGEIEITAVSNRIKYACLCDQHKQNIDFGLHALFTPWRHHTAPRITILTICFLCVWFYYLHIKVSATIVQH